MDLRQLRYFLAIAERSSFRAAADDLRLAQPALSQQMRRLESELGVKLFDRGARPVRLTDAGSHLVPRARSILADVERTTVELRDFASEPRGRLAVGAMQYLNSLELPDVLADFNRRFPLVDLVLRVGNTGELCEALVAGEIDLAICHADQLGDRPNFDIEPVRADELVIAIAQDDPRAGAGALEASELAGMPLITFRRGASMRAAAMALFERDGVTPHIAFESADMPTVVQLVARGLGVALIPRSVARLEPSIAALSVAPVPLVRNVALVTLDSRHRSLALAAFRDSAHAAMADTGG